MPLVGKPTFWHQSCNKESANACKNRRWQLTICSGHHVPPIVGADKTFFVRRSVHVLIILLLAWRVCPGWMPHPLDIRGHQPAILKFLKSSCTKNFHNPFDGVQEFGSDSCELLPASNSNLSIFLRMPVDGLPGTPHNSSLRLSGVSKNGGLCCKEQKPPPNSELEFEFLLEPLLVSCAVGLTNN